MCVMRSRNQVRDIDAAPPPDAAGRPRDNRRIDIMPLSDNTPRLHRTLGLLTAAAVLAVLVAISAHHYLLFHTLVEVFSAAVAFGIFMIAWNTRRIAQSPFVLFLGTAYLFVGMLDLLHTLAFKGMGVFPGHPGSNLATQLWLAGRGLECAALVLAFALVRRAVRAEVLLAAFTVVVVALLATLFVWPVFPVAFDETTGLTPFKKVTELVFIALLAVALVLLLRRRDAFDRRTRRLLAAAIVITMVSEACFTLYRADPYHLFNNLGHFAKLGSFYLIYRAIIVAGLRTPYTVLFREVARSRDALRRSAVDLERRVDNRTAELKTVVDELEDEMARREEAQQLLRRSEQRLFSVLNLLPGYVALLDGDYQIRFANDRFLDLFGDPEGRTCYAVQRGRDDPCENCPQQWILDTQRTTTWEWTCADGRTYRTWGYPFSDIDGQSVVLVLGLDITEQRRLQRTVLDAGEAERRIIGRDLHDSLGQKLSGLTFFAESLVRRLDDADARALAEQLIDVARDAVAEVRALSHGLDPISLDFGGLGASLTELARTTELRSGLACTCWYDDTLTLDDTTTCVNLYRIAQEAVSNAVKHAGGTHIAIDLRRRDDRAVLTITDNGRHTPPDPRGDGMGMHTMRHRANLMRGTLTINPDADGGTVVTCTIPLPPSQTELEDGRLEA